MPVDAVLRHPLICALERKAKAPDRTDHGRESPPQWNDLFVRGGTAKATRTRCFCCLYLLVMPWLRIGCVFSARIELISQGPAETRMIRMAIDSLKEWKCDVSSGRVGEVH